MAKNLVMIMAHENDSWRGFIPIIEQAIVEGSDLEMTYLRLNEMKLMEYRITPLMLEADLYLHAFSHTTQKQRVFKITRIAALETIEPGTGEGTV